LSIRSRCPAGKPPVTLRDAATYITKLSKAKHDADEWQAAMEVLLLVAEQDGPPLFARIGIMRALNRGHDESTVPRGGVRGSAEPCRPRINCGNVTQATKTAILEIVPATPLKYAKKLSLRSGVRAGIRRLRSRTRLINLRFKISRFRNQDGSKLRVCGFLGKLEKRRYLINEIIPA
jgi:hypothetical protein